MRSSPLLPLLCQIPLKRSRLPARPVERAYLPSAKVKVFSSFTTRRAIDAMLKEGRGLPASVYSARLPCQGGVRALCLPGSPAFLPVYTDGWKNLIARTERSPRVAAWLLHGFTIQDVSVCVRSITQPLAHSLRARQKQLGPSLRNNTGATVTHGSRVVSVSTRWGFSHRRPSLHLKGARAALQGLTSMQTDDCASIELWSAET